MARNPLAQVTALFAGRGPAQRASVFIGAIALALGAAEGDKPPPGLCVQAGILTKDGKPYRGIGANYFSLFSRTLKNPADTSYQKNLKGLSEAGIPFVRFMCGGFWPVDQKPYQEDKEAFFKRLDNIVKAAEENHVGLIPSLFWYLATVPDMVGEHLDQFGNPESKTSAHIRRYTEEIVARYKDSPALWAWELGNEYNLDADLPNSREQRPPVWPNLGTPKERTDKDELHFAELRAAFVLFAETVRKLDKTRPIISGNAMPRPSAYHNSLEKTWTLDTEEQSAEVLLRDNPDPMNVVSVHLYKDKKDIYPGGAKSLEAAVGWANKCAAKAGKPLFLGEFGAERQLGAEKERAAFEEFLNNIVKHQVPLAAFWVLDFDSQDENWNVDFKNPRAYMIELVAQANARLRTAR